VNSEQLRRALGRRNEATHPIELPDPLDELAAFHRREAEHSSYDDDGVRRAIQESIASGQLPPPPGTPGGWQEGDPCELCGEPDSPDDTIAHFVHAVRPGDYVMAHGQCGLDDGLRLA
jgi:hypothetical protein